MGVPKSASIDPGHAREAAFAIATSHILVRTTAALVEMDVFDALAPERSANPVTIQELAAAAMPGKAVNIKNLERMLRVMISNSAITETVDAAGERRYELGPLGKFFLKTGIQDSGSFAHYLLYGQAPEVQQSYRPLSELVVEPESARDLNGGTLYEFHQKHPELNKLFNQGMDGNSKVMMHAILDGYQSGFPSVLVLVDVGGGFGASLSAIIDRYPHIRGINFDLPGVIAESSPLPGVEHVGGDMFEGVPEGGDAIFLKWILHNWGDEDVVKVLKNCWKALPSGGKAIVVDHVVPEVIEPEEVDKAILIMDVMMMAHHNAKERKLSEFRKLGLAAGFSQVNLVCQIRSSGSVIEMLKA
ncbi:hypothetical protein M758_1G213900 [Ceratodon purpureus]|nr:hypothetical protein M758_1G213900 [Ceratodon purpureus]